jgi:hypothetical protein
MSDFEWMNGKSISAITCDEADNWCFTIQDAGAISVYSTWRLVADGRIKVSSADHNQRFGLPHPVDAREKALQLIASSAIVSASVNKDTADLTIIFANTAQLHILQTSSGYEAWQVNDRAGNSTIAQGGGRLVYLTGK